MAAEPRYCYRHPDRETGLSCSECERPICYECMTPAPVGLRCPEHSGKPQGIRRVTVAASRATTGVGSRRTAVVTMALIGVNVGVYLLELALGGSSDGTGNKIYEHGALLANGAYNYQGFGFVAFPHGIAVPGVQAAGVAHGEWWRLLSAAFLHYGPIHLGMNMLALYWYGQVLEHLLGRWRYLLLYLAAGLAGSAGALYATPNAVTVGASGAIFGVLGALLVLERRGSIQSGGQILGLIVINLAISYALPGISLGGHIGGLIGGFALMLAYVRFSRSPALCIASAVALAAASVVVAYSVI
jgi:membrane associated rhomboid family serine protease